MALGDFFKKAKDTVIGLAKKASNTLILGVQNTAKVFRNGLDFLVGRRMDEKNAQKLWDLLVSADVSPSMADVLVNKAREAFKDRTIENKNEILQFLKNEIKNFEQQLAATDAAVCSADEDLTRATEDSWYFRRFWLRVRPKFSFGVPGLTALEIVPELELLWQRDLPDGWKTYKPAPKL